MEKYFKIAVVVLLIEVSFFGGTKIGYKEAENYYEPAMKQALVEKDLEFQHWLEGKKVISDEMFDEYLQLILNDGIAKANAMWD